MDTKLLTVCSFLAKLFRNQTQQQQIIMAKEIYEVIFYEVDLNHANLHMAPKNCESHHSQATLLETQAQLK